MDGRSQTTLRVVASLRDKKVDVDMQCVGAPVDRTTVPLLASASDSAVTLSTPVLLLMVPQP